jgi:CBS domain-containing protein
MEISGTVSAILHAKSATILSIEPSQTVFEAIMLMAEHNIGALPVVAHGSLIGIVSERDYTRKVILRGRLSKETRVDEIMTEHLVTASPGDTVGACMRRMTEKRVRHLPVLEGGQLIGIVSIGDLVRWIISEQSATIDQLTKYIFGES